MTDPVAPSEFLVISRGKWNPEAKPADIQVAIDQFYVWLDELVDAGKMRRGQRLSTGGKTVYRDRVVTDGPYGEAKEVIGGFWFIVASSLEEAAAIASENPCLNYGLFLEIRPLELACATATATTNETPVRE